MITCDLLERRQSHFALWRPTGSGNAPVLIIGTFEAGNPNRLANRKDISLRQINANPGLWAIAAANCGLADGI
jgi:pullulanase